MPPSVSVVTCAYDLKRWTQLCEAVASVATRAAPVQEVLVVVDRDPELLRRAVKAGRDGGRVVRTIIAERVRLS